MINKYRKKPVIIEAVIWTGNNISEIYKFMNKDVNHVMSSGHVYIETLEGNMNVSIGDYIIKGIAGEFYPCKPDIFKETYETVSMVSDNDRTTISMSEYIKLKNKNKKLRNTINRLKRELEVED